ncbi:MAG: S8 family serine peptidase [Bacteroidetes bacterium]|nr:S8 family serine peptidase [Bacteroidota bacterium]
MKRLIKLSVSAAMLAAVFFIPLNSETSEHMQGSMYTKNKFFVKAKTELGVSEATGKIMQKTGIASIDALNKKYGVKRIERVFELRNGDRELFNKLEMSKIYVMYVDGSDDKIDNIIKDYSSCSDVEYGEPVFTGYAAGRKETEFFPNDTYLSKQWYLNNLGNIKPSSNNAAKVGEDINMLKAWEIEQGSADLIIAILDSGVEDISPDLKGRIWINNKEIPDNGIDDDGNGYIDDYKGWDFAYDDNNTHDGFGHGTNIASVIGANINNSYGFAGINGKSKLMICKNLSDNNTGEYEWWAKSIKYAADNGAKVINMSEGGDDFSKVLKTAVDYAVMRGVFLAAAMMNKGDGNNYYPAAYNGVFAVGATDSDGRRCRRFSWGGGSCYGKHISVVAPGNKIYGLEYTDPYVFDTYWSGTSQSTAIVSGLASLLFSQDKTRSAEDVKTIIKETARDRTGDLSEDKPGWDMYMGWGRVDCFLALTYNNENLRTSIDKNKVNDRTEVKHDDDQEEYIKYQDVSGDDGAKAVKEAKDNKNDKNKQPKDKPARKK